MNLAIVGSTRFEDQTALQKAEVIILEAFKRYSPEKVVSGGAKGIDSLGVILAKRQNIETLVFLPENHRWEPRGFKDRNMSIAENSDALIRISCRASKTYGSGWTADYAQRIGKTVERYIL